LRTNLAVSSQLSAVSNPISPAPKLGSFCGIALSAEIGFVRQERAARRIGFVRQKVRPSTARSRAAPDEELWGSSKKGPHPERSTEAPAEGEVEGRTAELGSFGRNAPDGGLGSFGKMAS
jgi:hypothetical protein